MSRHDGSELQPLKRKVLVRRKKRAGRARFPEGPPKIRAPIVDGSLPEGYGRTRIVLLPIDPFRVHVYWEVSDSDRRRVEALVEDGYLGPQGVLRFHDVTTDPPGGVPAADSFDVKIEMEARNWYVNLSRPERGYIVDLGFRKTDGRFHRITRSNPAATPPAWPKEEERKKRMRIAQADAGVHADHPVESPVEHHRAALPGLSAERSRAEKMQEGPRAVFGMAGIPAVTARAARFAETEPVDRPTESPREEGNRRMHGKPVADQDQGTLPVVHREENGGSLHSPAPNVAGENPRKKRGEVYERGNKKVDLSMLCDSMFVSGLSSGQMAAAGQRDDEDSYETR